MRLAVCALSAVLLSGCSWLGSGGQSGGYGAAGGAYGAGCAPAQAAYGHQSYAHQAGGAGCVGGAYASAGGMGYGMQGAGYGADGGMGYGMQGAGYGAGANGAAGYGMQGAGYGAGAAGYGMQGAGYGAGANGAAGYGMQGAGYSGAYGSNVTTLGGAAPYGTAVGGAYGAGAYGSNVVGTQFANGQYVNGAAVQTVQGAPIYVPQPYPAYYGVPQLRGAVGGFGAAMPFGLGLDGGTDFDIDGNLFAGKEAGPSEGGGGMAGAIDAISYNDAFGQAKSIGATAEYDLNRTTTLLGRVAYSDADGQTVSTGSFTPGTYDAAGVFTPTAGSTTRDLDGEFSNLETITVEAGLRKYVGGNAAFRPYVGANGGFIHNNDVSLTQTYADNGELFNSQEFIESGWNPTAAAVLGAEMSVGPRSAIGIESGIRWTDDMDTGVDSQDRWSIPVKLRGRVAF